MMLGRTQEAIKYWGILGKKNQYDHSGLLNEMGSDYVANVYE